MSTTEDFIHYKMIKEEQVKFVSPEQVKIYQSNGWKKGQEVYLGGKKHV